MYCCIARKISGGFAVGTSLGGIFVNTSHFGLFPHLDVPAASIYTYILTRSCYRLFVMSTEVFRTTYCSFRDSDISVRDSGRGKPGICTYIHTRMRVYVCTCVYVMYICLDVCMYSAYMLMYMFYEQPAVCSYII